MMQGTGIVVLDAIADLPLLIHAGDPHRSGIGLPRLYIIRLLDS
jgi:hypothetical protein